MYDPKFAAQQTLNSGRVSESTLRRMIPKGTPNTFKPSDTITEGYKYNYQINGTKMEVKWHSPDLNAATKFPNSNSGNMWTSQIKVGNKLLGSDYNFYRKAGNRTHIPLNGGE